MAKTIIENRYGVTPNELINNDKISLKAKGLYAYIQSKPDAWDFTIEGISSQCMEGVESVRNAIKELELSGYLRRKNYQDKITGRWDCDYTLYATPQKPKPLTVDIVESPHTGLPHTGQPCTENRHTKEERRSKQEEVKKTIQDIDLPDWLDKKIWDEWIEYRKEIKKKMTPITIKRQLRFLEANKSDHVAIIKESLQNGWTGLFVLKKKQIINNAVQAPKGKYDKY